MLSQKRLNAIRGWNDIEAAKDERAIVEGVVTEENKGGVVVTVRGVRVFVPASRTGLPRETPMAELLKKTVRLIITEVNQSRRRVVGSIAAVSSEERRERADKIWGEIEVGNKYKGVVKSLTSYGVFVDIGGIDGMVHVSELSWTHIRLPADVMSVGDEVEVYVISFDKEKRKISLGYKDPNGNPWSQFIASHQIGDVVTVQIVKLMPFGAFAELLPGVDGLIHISQIADRRLSVPSEVLTEGQTVDVKITDINNDKQKVSLSIRALLAPDTLPVTEREEAEAVASDNEPVVVYDTDSPPAPEEDEESAPEEIAE
jgi:4-hydroxy-3-methylbut-2-enyl diphosphate reductase